MGAPSPKVISFKVAKEQQKRERYADLVMTEFRRQSAEDERKVHRSKVERRTDAHFAAKNRF